MKSVVFYNDDRKKAQIIKVKMGIVSKFKFLFTGVIEVPYHFLN